MGRGGGVFSSLVKIWVRASASKVGRDADDADVEDNGKDRG